MTALSTFDSVDEVVFLIMSPMVARRYYSSLTLKYLSCVILVASCLRRRRAPRLDAFSIQGAEYVMHYWLVFFFDIYIALSELVFFVQYELGKV